MATDDSKDDPVINRKLLAIVDEALQASIKIKPDGYLTKRLQVLKTRLENGLNIDIGEDAELLELASSEEPGKLILPRLPESDVYRFVRLYNKNMPLITHENHQPNTWLKPLLDTIKTSEGHGLAIYPDEDQARRACRGEYYCYITIRINKQRDVTAQRPEKIDPRLNVPLSIITDLPELTAVKLTYQGTDLPIRNGELVR